MCGIFGYFNMGGAPLDPDLMRRMGSAIEHRGPDDYGDFVVEGAAIGNRRLSIIDLAGGHQPFVSDDGQIAVVQNGEIFNFVELADELRREGVFCKTRSDTEIILRLFERHGISFVSRLNGMFAIAILDLRHKQLYLIRDRLGVKPLYFAKLGTTVLFASEIKALFPAGVQRRVDLQAIDGYLSFNYVPLPLTAFDGVQHVMPGTITTISSTGVRSRRWWELAAIDPCGDDLPESYWIEEFLAILDDATRIRLRADVPFGAFLSGGVDSSTVVGLMAQHSSQPVTTFCIGFDDPRYDESRHADAASRRFGTRHIAETVRLQMLDEWPRVLWHCDQPHGDASFMPTLRVSELAANHVKVVLTGDGGDELFAGYEKYLQIIERISSPGLPGSLAAGMRRGLALLDAGAKRALYSARFRDATLEFDALGVIDTELSKVGHFDQVNQLLYFDTVQLLPGNNLVKPDRMGMAVSIEARTPFLDYRMVEFAFRMPGTLKLRHGELKYLYKKAVTPLIGRELAYRPKRMFTVPVGDWFRSELYGFCCETLLAPNAVCRELFEPTAVQQLLTDHRAGSRNLTREIRALLALELWAKRFDVLL